MCEDCETASGITIPVGPAGDDGSDGVFGGFSAEWLFDTNTGSAPGSTFLRLNNSTYSSVTHIYINETNADSINYAAFLAAMSNSNSLGHIRIFKEFDSTKFWIGQITALTDAGSYYDLTVTHILSNSTFSANDHVIVTFTPRGTAGANGADGTDGEDGTTILYNNTTQASASNTGASYSVLASGSLTPNVVDTNGEKLRITSNYTKQVPTIKGDLFYHKLTITTGGTTITAYDMEIPEDMVGGSVITEVTRLTSTTALIEFKGWYITSLGKLVNAYSSLTRGVSIDFSLSLVVNSHYRNTHATDTITHEQLTIEFYKRI